MAIKLDIINSFYTVDWKFIFKSLGAFAFNNIIIGWVKMIFESERLSILVNGSHHVYFQCGRGVRQGIHCLSHFFCILEDGLSRGVLNLRLQGKLSYISDPRGITPPSHIFYTNDLIIFCRVDIRGVRNLINLMESYEDVSGQEVRKEKISLFLSSQWLGNNSFWILWKCLKESYSLHILVRSSLKVQQNGLISRRQLTKLAQSLLVGKVCYYP